MTTATATPMLRWSSVRDCPRKAVFEANGAPHRDRTDREERILFRGRRIGRDYGDMLALKYGEAAIERERKIVWPLGIGHMDIYLPATKTGIEVLSSAHASESYTRSKLLQLVGYIEHDPEAENGALIILDPSDFSEERIIISPRSRQYGELVDEMHARISQVQTWADSGELPPRVCRKPGESHGHFCLVAAHCFEGWVPAPLEEITADEALIEAVAEFVAIKQARKQLGDEDGTLEKRQKDAQAIIDAADLPAGEVLVGPYKVTRTPVERKATFAWVRAETAGVFDPAAYAEFFKPGASYSTFKAERVDRSGDEFGDEAPF